MPSMRVSGLALAAALAVSGSGVCQAQAQPQAQSGDSAQAKSGEASNEIVVTAQKRKERLQDVPLAVTAVGGAALASRQINDSSSLAQAIPSLTFQQGTNATNNSFRLRGIGTSIFGLGVESAVSVVVDGLVAARQSQGFADLADIERIEVLRGPQGTLFGRNATAGVINVVTALPTKTFTASGDATVAQGDEYRIKGTVSGPLSSTLRARLTGFYNSIGGITQNVYNGAWVNGQKSGGVRGKLEWDATDNLNFLLTVGYAKSNQDCCNQVLIAAKNPVVAQLTAPVVASLTNRQINDDIVAYNNSEQKNFALQGNWNLGSASLTSITGYQVYYLAANQGPDRIVSNPVVYVGSNAYASWPTGAGTTDLKNFTQELRLASNGKKTLNYVLGVYYSDMTIDREYTRRRASCASGVIGQPCAVAPVWASSHSSAYLKDTSYAAFGQLDYAIVGGLKALGGFRVQHQKVSVAGNQVSPYVNGDILFAGNAPVSGVVSKADTALTGKIGLQYEFSRDVQTYASFTRGYKGPGFNTEIGTDFARQAPVLPEYVSAYEVGFKGQTADRRFSLNAALFLADYSNLQVQANVSDPANGVTSFITTNAGKSRTKGVELEAVFRPIEGLTINAGFTYAKTELNADGLNCPLQFQGAAQTFTSNFPDNTCFKKSVTAGGVTTVSGPQQNVRGGILPASPAYRFNIAPRYEFAVKGTDLTAFAQTSVNYQSSQNYSLEQDPLLLQPAYALVDLSVGARQKDGRYSVTFFVKNLFNQNYLSSIAHNSLLATTANPSDLIATYAKDANRYVGGTIGVKF